jgi:hypothetical protein
MRLADRLTVALGGSPPAVQVDHSGGVTPLCPGPFLSMTPRTPFGSSRLDRDRQTALTKMPTNTQELRSADYGPDGVGWVYSITNTFGITFQFFVNFTGMAYEVWLVSPEIEAKFKNPHDGHIFASGKICLQQANGGGMLTLETAFAKSAVWAEGIAVVLNGGKFPWNYDQ